ncbi:type II toxin-antitoxin system VapC family toxin [Candidatus Sumerlaeota bacterium]|nr:type II toxin-antitoxin system VapC family toxin [Candidatus Sumerlaeota bacterium]
MIVADTNTIAYLFVPGDRTAEVRRAFEEDPDWRAPLLWRSEFCNVLSLLCRTRGMSVDDAARLMDEALRLFRNREYESNARRVLALSVESGCSSYDCEFVALAQELGTHLLTFDRKIVKAFPGLAILPRDFAPR